MILHLRLFLLGAFILFCSPLFAQKLTGTVTSAGAPLQGCSVRALPANIGSSTDSAGHYSLALKPGVYQVTFSAIGLEKKTLTVQFVEGESKVLNVELAISAE